MISERDLTSLPTDPIAAFLQIEAKLREEFEGRETFTEVAPVLSYSRYMNGVIAAAEALDLDMLDGWKHLRSASELRDQYPDFALELDRFVLANKIRLAKRQQDFSVSLDTSTKEKIRHFISKIKEIVDRLEIPAKKKDAIYKKVSALELEVNRSRTQLTIAMEGTLEVADTAGAVGKKLAPVRKLFGNINSLLGHAKDVAEIAALPPPQRQLPPPGRETPSN